tara:strand:+ start:2229 stop:2489 length:261 start_codon:yes stop_codon:yes gene_type:complete
MEINKQTYITMMQDTFARFRPRIEAASVKAGWDPIFRVKTQSMYDVIKQRDEVLRQIILEAKTFGINLQVVDSEEYKSEFDGKTIK